jgi:hypothetical protein
MWNFASNFAIPERARFFYMPQSWDMGQIILLPLRRKACMRFFQPEKSDGFGRERTRDLGYQRPKQHFYIRTRLARRLIPIRTEILVNTELTL